MKSKILIFIIGLFVGVIIATAGFLLYGKLNNKQGRNFNGERPQMMQQNGVDGENQAIPPENHQKIVKYYQRCQKVKIKIQ